MEQYKKQSQMYLPPGTGFGTRFAPRFGLRFATSFGPRCGLRFGTTLGSMLGTGFGTRLFKMSNNFTDDCGSPQVIEHRLAHCFVGKVHLVFFCRLCDLLDQS